MRSHGADLKRIEVERKDPGYLDHITALPSPRRASLPSHHINQAAAAPKITAPNLQHHHGLAE